MSFSGLCGHMNTYGTCKHTHKCGYERKGVKLALYLLYHVVVAYKDAWRFLLDKSLLCGDPVPGLVPAFFS